MNAIKVNFDNEMATPLYQSQATPSNRSAKNINCQSAVMIPNYPAQLEKHYGVSLSSSPFSDRFDNFGLKVRYEQPVELDLVDQSFTLNDQLRRLVKRYGFVTFENASISSLFLPQRQYNIFPDLRFHYDRAEPSPEIYSLFIRDPRREEQKHPRKSSTLVMDNNAVYLQAQKENLWEGKMDPAYQFFGNENIHSILGTVAASHPWTAPFECGELAILDNRTVYHASFYREGKGYQIGVHYVK